MGFRLGAGDPRVGSPISVAALQRLVYGVVALVVLSLVVVAATASAAEYTPPELPGGASEPSLGASSCPEAPAGAYEGEDDAAAEVRALRVELAALCTALAQRSDAVSHRLWWLVSEASVAHAQRASTLERLEAVEAALAAPVSVGLAGIDAEHPLPVDPGGEGSLDTSELVASVDASAEASQGGLYFIAGLLVSCFLGYCFWRTVQGGT